MKKIIIATILSIMALPIFAQSSGVSVLQSELVKMLQSEGILLTDQQKACTGNCQPASPWKNDRQRKKAIVKDSALMNYLISNFTPPTFVNGQNIITNLTYSGQSLTRIGRYLIKNGDLSVINSKDPQLPILNINQISIPNPIDGASNYTLNYTMNNLFTNTGKINVESSFQSYISGKLQDETNVSKDKKMEINIAAGVFENQLATLYGKALDRTITPLEFAPLYYLWLAYKNQKAAEGDEIISSFNGVCYYTTQGTTNSFNNVFNSSVNGSGTFPFLSYGIDDKTNWTKTNEMTSGARDYKIYLFKQPQLVKILSTDQIIQSWKDVSTIPDPISIKSPLVLANTPLVIQVKFGPVPTSEFSSLRLDTAFIMKNLKGTNFIQKIMLNNDPKSVVNNTDGYYIFNIEITRNEDFIANNSTSSSKVITATFPLRLYFDNAVNGKYLETVYSPIKIQTETLPVPYLNPYNMVPTKDANFYTFKSNLQFDIPDGMSIKTSPVPPKILDVQSTTNASPELIALAKNAMLKPVSNNTFEISFKVPVAKQYFSFTQPFHSFYCIVNFTGDNQTYSRRCEFTLTGADDQITTSAQTANVPVVLNNNNEVITALDTNAKVNDGRKISDIIVANTENGRLNVVTFIDNIKKVTNLSVTKDNKYIIDNKYLSSKKHRSQINNSFKSLEL